MEKINVSLIIEILGKPKDHVKDAMESIVTKIAAEKGVKVLDKRYHEPTPIEKSDLFTTFAELEVEFDALENFFGIIFAYMPSHIEITRPEKLVLTNSDLNTLGNALTQRLHNYDSITKKLTGDNRILSDKLKEIAPHLFKQVPKKEEPAPEDKSSKKKTKKKKKSR